MKRSTMRRLENQDRLIEAVKKRPLLYSRYHPEFSDRQRKLSLWHEVCEELIPGWAEFPCGKKGEMVCEIQRRWKTLRDGFSRELQFQRQDRMKKARGEIVRRRKIYGYFNHLKFLLKQKKKPSEDGEEVENDDNDQQSESESEDSDAKEEETVTPAKPFKTEPGAPFYVDIEGIKGFDTNKSEIERLENDRIGDEDEDKLFCLSLVSSFRKMNEKQKYDARIGIMQVISDVRFRNADEPEQPIV